jgi:serine/threonine protein kinase
MSDSAHKAKHIDKVPPDTMNAPSDSFTADNDLQLLRDLMNCVSGRFEVLAEAGRGGMGVIYRARDHETDEVVALKTLRPELASDTRLLERFKRELRLARRITHKNVCRVYDIHRTADLCFVTMEFVDGVSLRSFLHRHGALKVEEGIAIARQICAALREAHKQGIVHRDLKPENVMLDQCQVVKVMDFGIARSLDTMGTFTAGTVGTPAYMAPEQAEGRPVDHRSDIYSLGLVLYEVFTGVAAFTADSAMALAWKQVHEAPVRPRDLEPSLPSILEKAILKCLEKDPSRRFQSAEELDIALGKMPEASPGKSEVATPKKPSWFITASGTDLPPLPRLVPITLFVLLQVLYLTFYLIALAKFGGIQSVLSQHLSTAVRLVAEGVRVTAILGIGLRLYLLAAIAFGYSGIGNDFRRLSFLLIPLDVLWAFSPLLLLAAGKLGSLSLACTVALLFLPVSQRTLVRMVFAWGKD